MRFNQMRVLKNDDNKTSYNGTKNGKADRYESKCIPLQIQGVDDSKCEVSFLEKISFD